MGRCAIVHIETIIANEPYHIYIHMTEVQDKHKSTESVSQKNRMLSLIKWGLSSWLCFNSTLKALPIMVNVIFGPILSLSGCVCICIYIYHNVCSGRGAVFGVYFRQYRLIIDS